MKRNGQCLPGCDITGKRLIYDTVLKVPEDRRDALRALLLDRVPVRRAAIETGIGGSTAYKIRDQLRDELALQGQTLARPALPGSAKSTVQPWLPPQRGWWVLYRKLETAHGHEAARAMIETALRTIGAIPEAIRSWTIRHRRSRPLTFEEQLARVRAGAGLVSTFVPSRAPPSITLGGVSSAMI